MNDFEKVYAIPDRLALPDARSRALDAAETLAQTFRTLLGSARQQAIAWLTGQPCQGELPDLHQGLNAYRALRTLGQEVNIELPELDTEDAFQVWLVDSFARSGLEAGRHNDGTEVQNAS